MSKSSKDKTKTKMQFYKKWWFWLIIVIVIVAAFSPDTKDSTSNTTFSENKQSKSESRERAKQEKSESRERVKQEKSESRERVKQEKSESREKEKAKIAESKEQAKLEKEKNSDIRNIASEPTDEQEITLLSITEDAFNKQYPYKGSKLHNILGVIQPWTSHEDKWYYKVSGTIANAFGAEVEANVEVYVTPISDNSGTVEFVVY